MNKDQLIEAVIGNTFDIGIMIGETGNKNHPAYPHKKKEFRDKTIQTMKKELEAIVKLMNRKKQAPMDELERMEQKISENLLEVMV